MKKLAFLLVLFVSTNSIYAAVTRITLSKALSLSMVAIEAEGTDNGYMHKGIQLHLTNKSGSTLMVTMDQGVILESDSSGFQPLILAGEELLVLQPYKSGDIEVQTFCGYSSNRAPYNGLTYNYSRVCSDTLLKVLAFIKQNHLFDDLGQSAVWVLTNGHSLNRLYDPTRDQLSKKCIAYMASLTGLPIPTYYYGSDINDAPGQPVYNPKPLKIYAQFEEILTEPKTLTLAIYDQQGVIRQPVFENKRFGKNGHRFRVEFEAKDVPEGKYYIRLKEGDNVLQEKEVIVE